MKKVSGRAVYLPYSKEVTDALERQGVLFITLTTPIICPYCGGGGLDCPECDHGVFDEPREVELLLELEDYEEEVE